MILSQIEMKILAKHVIYGTLSSKGLRAPNRDRTGEYRQSFQNLFYCFKWIKKDPATICNKQNQNRPIRTGDTAYQRVRRHYAGPMTSCDVIGLPPVTISLVTLYNCFFTVEDFTKDTQEISGSLLSFHTDVVRGGSLSYIAPTVTLGGCAITFSPVK